MKVRYTLTAALSLTIATRLQDVPPGLEVTTATNIRSSISLVLLLYYLALSISPSPSTYNNLGIFMQALPMRRTHIKPNGEHEALTGTMLARIYYERGLDLYPGHPHLLTNLGSLLKDQGFLSDAIRYFYSIRLKTTKR